MPLTFCHHFYIHNKALTMNLLGNESRSFNMLSQYKSRQERRIKMFKNLFKKIDIFAFKKNQTLVLKNFLIYYSDIKQRNRF